MDIVAPACDGVARIVAGDLRLPPKNMNAETMGLRKGQDRGAGDPRLSPSSALNRAVFQLNLIRDAF